MTAEISKYPREVENVDSAVIDFLKSRASVLYILATFRLVVHKRLRKFWSPRPWKRRNVNSSRTGKASSGRSEGKCALSRRSLRSCGRLAMIGRYSDLKGE